MENKNTFIGWIKKYKQPTNNDNKFIFEELEKLNIVKNEFRNQMYLLKKYMDLIRENYDSQTIIRKLESVGIDGKTSLAIHKIMFHSPDKAKCFDYIEELLHNHGKELIDKIKI